MPSKSDLIIKDDTWPCCKKPRFSSRSRTLALHKGDSPDLYNNELVSIESFRTPHYRRGKGSNGNGTSVRNSKERIETQPAPNNNDSISPNNVSNDTPSRRIRQWWIDKHRREASDRTSKSSLRRSYDSTFNYSSNNLLKHLKKGSNRKKRKCRHTRNVLKENIQSKTENNQTDSEAKNLGDISSNPPEIVNIATQNHTIKDKIQAKNKIRFQVEEANDPILRSKSTTGGKRRTVVAAHQNRINDLKHKLEDNNRVWNRKASLMLSLKKKQEIEDQTNTWILPNMMNERVKGHTFSLRPKKKLNENCSRPQEEYNNAMNPKGYGQDRRKFIKPQKHIRDFHPNSDKMHLQGYKNSENAKAGYHFSSKNRDIKRGDLK